MRSYYKVFPIYKAAMDVAVRVDAVIHLFEHPLTREFGEEKRI